MVNLWLYFTPFSSTFAPFPPLLLDGYSMVAVFYSIFLDFPFTCQGTTVLRRRFDKIHFLGMKSIIVSQYWTESGSVLMQAEWQRDFRVQTIKGDEPGQFLKQW